MTTALTIADAVVAELNTAPPGTFPLAFTARRRVLPEFELSELTELKVTVVPKAALTEGSTRSIRQWDWEVDVGVQQKLGKALDDEVPALMELATSIAGYLSQRPLAAAPEVAWVRARIDTLYAPEQLAGMRAFTSVVTLTYRGMA